MCVNKFADNGEEERRMKRRKIDERDRARLGGCFFLLSLESDCIQIKNELYNMNSRNPGVLMKCKLQIGNGQ
jgi:hypothetical protein